MDIVRCIPETKGDGSRPLPSRRVHSCSSKLAFPRCGLRAVRTRAALWLTRLVAGRGFGNVFSDLHRECSSVFQIWVGSCQVAQGGTAMLMSPGCTRCVPRMASILRTTASAFDTSVRCHPGPHIRQDCCSGFRLLNLQVVQAIYEPLIAALGSLTLSLSVSLGVCPFLRRSQAPLETWETLEDPPRPELPGCALVRTVRMTVAVSLCVQACT